MPVPDFSPGEVLTAAAMDSIGLWLVKTVTIGAGVTSVPVTGAFSADYQNYRIIITNNSSNGGASHLITLNNASTLYYVSGHFFSWGGGGATVYSPVVQPNWVVSANNSAGNPCEMVLDILNPFQTLRTAGSVMSDSANGSSIFQLLNANSVSHTGFTLSKAGDTMTGGTIRVYGYRN
jgi:hypothetical protein